MDSVNHPAATAAGQLETRRVRVTGLVQGVGFRYATLRHARLLEVHGWVRNCADGSVEAMIQGSRQQLDLMQRWMRHGPRTAQVQGLSASTIENRPIFTRFEQHPTA